MTKNEKYWSNRFERLKRREMAKADTLTAGTARMYQEALEKLRKDVVDWYVRYADENGLSLADAQKQLDAREMKAFKLKLEHYVTLAKKKGLPERYQAMLEQASIRTRLDRSQQIYIQTAHHIEVLANRQNLDLTELLANVYGDSYYRTAYETQQMKGFSPFRQIGQEQIDTAISKPWAPDGKDFSSRIWENKDQLIQNLHVDLTHALMTGGGTTAIAEGIAKRMNTSFFNARRLIETETAYVQEKAAFDCYKELDVEQYQILAVLDRKTSRICRKLDGKVFAVKDAKPGVTMPPFHCHCRTTTVPYLEELEGEDIGTTRAARDPDTGKTVFVEGDMTYEKWYNKYVKKPSFSPNGGSSTAGAGKKVNPTTVTTSAMSAPGAIQSQPIPKKPLTPTEIRAKLSTFDLAQAKAQDVIDIGKAVCETHNVPAIIGDKKALDAVFGQYRPIGGTVTKSSFATSAEVGAISTQNRQMLIDAFSHYPAAWGDYLHKSGRKIFTRKADRGFFSQLVRDAKKKPMRVKKGDPFTGYATIHMDERRATTPFHEIGHLIEFLKPDALRISKEFVVSRTAGEATINLADVLPWFNPKWKEMTKKDSFISPYIGKEYKGASEVLSMGLESVFEPMAGQIQYVDKSGVEIRKMITDDEEYLHLIVGMLLTV